MVLTSYREPGVVSILKVMVRGIMMTELHASIQPNPIAHLGYV